MEKLKQYAFNSYPSLIKRLDYFISKNKIKYPDRTYLINQLIEEKLKKEKVE